MARNIGIVIYVILQFMAFFFVLVGTPLDMFRGTIQELNLTRFCLTLWGAKADCTSTSYFATSDEFWDSCPGLRDRFRAAQAFAVISILVYGAAFVLGVLMLCFHLLLRWVCLALNIAGIVTLGIVWVLMVVTYIMNDGGSCPDLNSALMYGSGFALFLVAWCLDAINIPVLMVRCQEKVPDVSEKPEAEEEPEPKPEAVPMQGSLRQEEEEVK